MDHAPSHRFRRRKFIVDKKLQLKYIILFFVLILFVNSAVIMSLYSSMKLLSSSEISDNYIISKVNSALHLSNSGLNPAIISETLKIYRNYERDMFWETLFSNIAPCIIILAVFLFLASVFVSHKIAGPLFSIKRSVHLAASGDLRARFSLRKGDEFHELADELNVLVTSVKQSLLTLRDIIKTTKACEDLKETQMKLKAMEQEIERYKID